MTIESQSRHDGQKKRHLKAVGKLLHEKRENTTEAIYKSMGLGFGHEGMIHNASQTVTGDIRSDRAVENLFLACELNAAVSFARATQERTIE